MRHRRQRGVVPWRRGAGGSRRARRVFTSRYDQMLDSRVDWRIEAAEVRDAYARWLRSREERGLFAAYRAALDREECAAQAYATALDDVRHLTGWRGRG